MSIELLKKWREHIRDVYERRGRSDVYIPNEVFHTCHGCGMGGGRIWTGLCETCQREYCAAIGEEHE